MAEFMKVDQQKLQAIERTLGRLPGKLAKKVFRTAGRKAAGVIRRAAQARARSQFNKISGKLAKGVKVQIKIKSRGSLGSDLTAKVGLSPVGKGVTKELSVFYGRFLEKGTKSITAKAFIEPAFDAKKGQALQIFKDELRKGVESAAGEARR